MRLLRRDGWYEVSRSGSHVKMRHPTKAGQLIVPDHGAKELAPGTERSIRKQAGV